MYSLYGGTLALNYLVGKDQRRLTQNSAVQNRYLALYKAEPSMDMTEESATALEPTANSYKRCKLSTWNNQYEDSAFGDATLNASGTATEISNNREITFNEAEENWGTCTHFAIYENQTGGKPLYIGALVTSISPVANSVPLIKVGQLKITLA